MAAASVTTRDINQRVRGILLTGRGTALMIKRVKPSDGLPYWIVPGGGVEPDDRDLNAALMRELREELGAAAPILAGAFVLEHEKAGKKLEEHFFVCRLAHYDLSQRAGPEFDDPTRGEFIPDEVALERGALLRTHFRTPEARDWMLQRLDWLNQIA